MKTLTLSLKKKWYDMIASGEKKEEYRELTVYWLRRLAFISNSFFEIIGRSISVEEAVACPYIFDLIRFDAVTFTLGYPKKDDMSRRMTFKIADITIDEGKPEWGAEEGKRYFVIKLGERI